MKRICCMILCFAILISGILGTNITGKKAEAAEYKIKEAVFDAMSSNVQNYTITEEAIMIPIQIKKAGMVHMIAYLSGNTESCYYYYLKKNELAGSDDNYLLMGKTGKKNRIGYEYAADRAQFIYLLIIKDKSEKTKPVQVTISSTYTAPDYGREIKSGEKVTAYQVRDTEYWKFKLAKNSVVTCDGETVICNAKKKVISEQRDSMWLKKGTYYIKTTFTGKKEFSLKAQAVKMTPGKNTSRKKAKKITVKKKIQGAISLEAKTYYYKLSVKKKKKVIFKYSNSAEDLCMLSVYTKKGKVIYGQHMEKKKGKLTGNGLKAGKKLSLEKGTYWIKIVPIADGSGTYSIAIK